MENHKVTIITGASSGIGLESARLFAKRGDIVVLAARRADRLKELSEELNKKGFENLVVPIDLSVTSGCEHLIKITMEHFGKIDVLVNNAGFGEQIILDKMPWEDIEKMFNVNILSMIKLSQAVIPIMKAQKKGSIINISSVGGLVSHPLNVIYCTTKHAVTGFGKSLRLELKGTGINVVTICPAATTTEFFKVAERDIPFPSFMAVPAIKVARRILKESERNNSVVFPSSGAFLLVMLDKWLPSVSEYINVKYKDFVTKN